MKNQKIIIGSVMTVMLLAGCSTKMIYEGRLDYDDGWRKGVVTDIGAGQKFTRQSPPECKFNADFPSSSEKFAIIRYRKNNSPKWRTAPIPISSQLKVDDMVYVNINECKASVVPQGKI